MKHTLVKFTFLSRDPNSRKQITHSFSREEADQDLDELSEDMRVKSSLLLAQNLEQTKAFFGKLKNYVDFLSMPNYRLVHFFTEQFYTIKFTRQI